MKKVWIMNHYAVPPTMGGITRHFDYARELSKKGYDVTVVASSFDGKTRTEKLIKNEKYREELIEGVKFLWIKTTPYKKNNYKRLINMISFSFNSYRVCKKLSKPDTIIASSVHLFNCISAYLLSKYFKSKYIAEIRDLWPQTLIDIGAMNEKSFSAKVFRFLEMFVYKKAERIVVLLPGFKNYIKDKGINEEKIIYIPNGVSIEKFDDNSRKSEVSEQINNILNENKEYFKAIYLGAIGVTNGLDNLLEMAKIVQEKEESIHIIVVGDGTELERLKLKAKELDLNNLFFYSPIKKSDVPILLKNIDICLFNLPKIDVFKYGISPNKLFDYMCASKPIVFSCSAMNNIVAEAEAGISVSPDNPNEFAKAVLTVYNMMEKDRNGLGYSGRKYLEEFHDIASLVDKFEQII